MHIFRMATVYEPNVELLPAEFRAVLTDDDVKAIQEGPEFFGSLVRSTDPAWLRGLLEKCAEDSFQLQFVSWGESAYRPYFQFSFAGACLLAFPEPLRSERTCLHFFAESMKPLALFGKMAMTRPEDFFRVKNCVWCLKRRSGSNPLIRSIRLLLCLSWIWRPEACSATYREAKAHGWKRGSFAL